MIARPPGSEMRGDKKKLREDEPTLREALPGLPPYIFAGIAYIGCGLIFQGILYSSFTGVLFLLAFVWGIPALWRRIRGGGR
jgi:hypothetical protein